MGGEALVITHDMMVEGRHWRSGADMADVAWKLVAAALSDLAAKGAAPLGVLVGYTLGEGEARFVEGLREVLETFRVPLLGGDTVAGDGARTLGCTAIGRATHRPVPDRRGARAGDAVFVTGPLGNAMLGFEGSPSGSVEDLAHRRPTPLLAHGQALAPLVSAMMDVSDGLLLDAWRMASASRVSFLLDSAAVPVAVPARRGECLRWGDDYALLFTAGAEVHLPVAAHWIGVVADDCGSPLVLDGAPLTGPAGLGYQHDG